MDTMPAWFWVPAAIVLWAAVLAPFVVALVRAEPDPYPDELSRLDVLDRG